MFKEEDLNTYINNYIAKCNDLGLTFSKVILFGSYAKKNPHECSDIDLALVSHAFTGFPLDDRKKISKANILFSEIEPHTFSESYFANGDPFIDEIKKTGIEFNISDEGSSQMVAEP